jgi:hypothetical protein
MFRFRVVLFQNPGGVEIKHVEKVDLKEIEKMLRSENITGIFIGKE